MRSRVSLDAVFAIASAVIEWHGQNCRAEVQLLLEEFQAAHERIFKAMDADHDGTVTFEEMEAFIRGH